VFECTCGITLPVGGWASPGVRLMRIKVSVTLSSDLVDKARRLGLNMSRIVEAGLRLEMTAECFRQQADRAGDREGDGTGSGTGET
jgi:post-segregation antitoxin (ccd killing protein)